MCFTHEKSCVGRVLGLGGCSDLWGGISGDKHLFLLLMCQGSPFGQPNQKVEQGAHLGYSCKSVFRVQSRVEDGYRVANRRNSKGIFYHSILPFSLLFTFFSYIYLSSIYYLWVIGLRAEKTWKQNENSTIVVKVKSLSHVRLFVTPWTVAYQAPPSMGFSRQEYRSGLPFPSPGDLPAPGIEPTGLLHCRQKLYCLSHLYQPFNYSCEIL